MEFTEALIYGVIVFVVLFTCYYFLYLKRKYNEIVGNVKKKRKPKLENKPVEFMELNYLVNKFKLDKKKIDLLYCLKWIAVIDSGIITIVVVIISLIPWSIIWQLLVGFVLLFALIYSIFEIFGRHLVKKGWRKK